MHNENSQIYVLVNLCEEELQNAHIHLSRSDAYSALESLYDDLKADGANVEFMSDKILDENGHTVASICPLYGIEETLERLAAIQP